MKFRKKPVVIESIQWTGDNLDEVLELDQPDQRRMGTNAEDHNKELRIATMEGIMKASVGDWIIKGVEGELYPCKPSIFESTYEAVTDDWDPMNHEHIEGFQEHLHPHTPTTHSNMNGLVGEGKNTGNTFVSVDGIEPAIVGEPPESQTS